MRNLQNDQHPKHLKQNINKYIIKRNNKLQNKRQTTKNIKGNDQKRKTLKTQNYLITKNCKTQKPKQHIMKIKNDKVQHQTNNNKNKKLNKNTEKTQKQDI